jgi:hypothetical protein
MPVYRVIEPRLGALRLRDWRRRTLRVFGLLLALVLVCAIGLTLLDNSAEPPRLKFLQGLWNALNLVTTLGDFTHFDPYQKLFVMFVMIGVMVIGAYAVGQLTGLLSNPAVVAYRENRAMQKSLDNFADHAVVIGYVGAGRLLADRLHEAARPLVVIDRNEDAAAQASERGIMVIKDDAGIDDGTLVRAGLGRARVLFVATSDADRNLAIVLMAHALNPALKVVVCADNAHRAELLRRAGATNVIVADGLLAEAMIGQAGPATA